MKHTRCMGSQKFPTNYDGEYTVCPVCRRKMKLHRNGKVPRHNTVGPKVYKERIPGGVRML